MVRFYISSGDWCFVELLSQKVTILIYRKGPSIILVSGKLSQHSQLWHHLLRDQQLICALFSHSCLHALIWFWSARCSSTGNNLLISFCIWATKLWESIPLVVLRKFIIEEIAKKKKEKEWKQQVAKNIQLTGQAEGNKSSHVSWCGPSFSSAIWHGCNYLWPKWS